MKFLGFILVVVVIWKVTPPDISFLSFGALVLVTLFVLSLIAKKL